jgi:hypothetical protein
MSAPETFEVLFCRMKGCPSSEFQRRVFRKTLARHAVPFAGILRRCDPDFFREDMEFIRDVGAAVSRDEVVGELNRFFGRNLRDRNWVRRVFGLRVSGMRLLQIWDRASDAAASHHT